MIQLDGEGCRPLVAKCVCVLCALARGSVKGFGCRPMGRGQIGAGVGKPRGKEPASDGGRLGWECYGDLWAASAVSVTTCDAVGPRSQLSRGLISSVASTRQACDDRNGWSIAAYAEEGELSHFSRTSVLLSGRCVASECGNMCGETRCCIALLGEGTRKAVKFST